MDDATVLFETGIHLSNRRMHWPSGKKVKSLFGMKFFRPRIEPEMVNHESRLYREHPDWLLGEPGRPQCHGRNQFVLITAKPEVVKGLEI